MNFLETKVEGFLAASPENLAVCFAELVRAMKSSLTSEAPEVTAPALRRSIVPTLDYTSALTLCRFQKQICKNLRGDKLRLAILGSITTTQICQLTELFLFSVGIEVEIYEAEYGTFRQEILDPNSGLYTFQPKIIFIVPTWRDLSQLPTIDEPRERVIERLAEEWADWKTLWRVANEKLGCQIIQSNFALPPWRTLANYELAAPASIGGYISEVNRIFSREAPTYVTIHDADNLAASAGRWVWGDERFFHHAKLPCAPEFLVDYAHSSASLITAHLGLAKKCLVLDLDNTLWGGRGWG